MKRVCLLGFAVMLPMAAQTSTLLGVQEGRRVEVDMSCARHPATSPSQNCLAPSQDASGSGRVKVMSR